MRHSDSERRMREPVSRRQFLKATGLTAAAAALAACTPAAQTVLAPTSAASTTKWPVSNMTTDELLAFYDKVLPFRDQLSNERRDVLSVIDWSKLKPYQNDKRKSF